MRCMILGLLLCICTLSCSRKAENAAAGTGKIIGGMNLVGVPVDSALNIYRGATESELVIASNVQLAKHTITLQASNLHSQDLAPLVEHALLIQAGVILTRLDEKRVSVTYNDRMILQQ